MVAESVRRRGDGAGCGGPVTFEEFAAWHLPAVLRFATVLVGSRAAAEDIAQEVLARACARWGSIGALDRPEMYVRKMILNEFLTARRRSRRLVLAGSSAEVEDRVTPDYAAAYAERDELLAELAKLPAKQRAVLVLRYYEGLSDSGIADLLGVAPGTVRGYASRALAALRIEFATGPTAGEGTRGEGS